MSIAIDRDTVKMWREHGEEAIRSVQEIEQRSYEESREKLAARFREQLDEAAQRRYLILPYSHARSVQDMEAAYYHWCRANLQPLLIINHTVNKHICKIEFYLSECKSQDSAGRSLRDPSVFSDCLPTQIALPISPAESWDLQSKKPNQPRHYHIFTHTIPK